MNDKELIIKKYNGDDQYSYAIFRKKDVTGLGNVIVEGQATPLITGCTIREAKEHKEMIERGENQ